MRVGRLTTTGLALFGALAGSLIFSGAPALAAPPEKPVTKPATLVAGTTATLNGELNPTKSATTGYDFTYNTNGTCTEGATTTPGSEAKGTKIKVSTPVIELIPSTEYTFCVVAIHEAESTSGLPLKFKTHAVAPVVDSEGSSGVTPFQARLEALVNPENQITSCEFQYGKTNTYGTSVPCEPASLEGFSEQGVGSTVTGLEGGTTYHFRVLLENAAKEKTPGADQQLTTVPAEAPAVSAESVSGLTSTDAKLAATVNPNDQETTYHFEYATNETLEGATVVAGGTLEAGTEPQPVGPVDIGGGLTPRTTYYYRIVAEDITGSSRGPIRQFTTLATPVVTTGPAQDLTSSTAVLSGTVNPAGAPTIYRFVYIDEAGYEAALAEKAADPYAGRQSSTLTFAGSGYEPQLTGPVAIGELSPETTYHYALEATNPIGTTTGADQTFTTLPETPPFATTGEAVGVTQLAATLTGAVNTQGLQTTLQFEFGTIPGQGVLEIASVIPGSESGSSIGIQTSFGNYLQAGTTYYYRAVATNADGTSYGVEKSFTTGSFPGLPTVAPTPIIVFPASLLPTQPKVTIPPIKPLTNAQKLSKALKACKKKPKTQRSGCERQARRRYRAGKKGKPKKK
jgi:hypothetical protein